ncbi:MAG: N-acetyltransferase family protein [Gemmatimonadota bacterium]
MRIRLAVPTDGPVLAEIYAPAVRDRTTSFEIDAPDGVEMARRVSTLLARTPWLVFEREGVVTGYAYASPHRDRAAYQWSVEVSAYVFPSAHRGGVGRRLYSALFEILALQRFQNAYAGITLPNVSSEAFHRSMGFTPVGVYHGVGFKFGAWHDVAWYERGLRPRENQPGTLAPPIPLSELGDRETLEKILGRSAGL